MKIIDQQLTEGLMLSRLPQFKRREGRAVNDIKAMILQHPKTYLSLSWGKQSIILAHIIWRIKSNIPVVFFDGADSELIADFKTVKQSFLAKWAINYVEIPDADIDMKRIGPEYMRRNNLDGIIMGLSADESKGRAYTLNKADANNMFSYANGTWRCCPLAKWAIKDYAAYTAKYDLPLLSTYKKYGFQARTSAGVTPGSHAEVGRDILSSTNQNEIDKRWSKRCSLKSYSI